MFRKFRFEQDFYGQLRCIPFAVRHKLDVSGVKLSLKVWNLFSEEERLRLCELSAEGEGLPGYREELAELLRAKGEPVQFLDKTRMELERSQWGPKSQVPPELEEKLSQLGLRISPEEWEKLEELQRFALFKLSQGKHDHANLELALREFLEN